IIHLPLSTFLFKYIIEHISIAIIQIIIQSKIFHLYSYSICHMEKIIPVWSLLKNYGQRPMWYGETSEFDVLSPNNIVIKLLVGFLLPCPTQMKLGKKKKIKGISLIFSIFLWKQAYW
ncbi:hypothetical protein ACJX0J_033778, partial [Zea mays]